ncbi:MAG: 1,4-dihydroxy-6-naphthoate synthase [Bacteroidales bacterium]
MDYRELQVAFSPCPNDTFIFDALINKDLTNGEYRFKTVIKDIDELNKLAQTHEFDLIKVSAYAFAFLSDSYQILDSGAALGKNNGPLLVAKQQYDLSNISKLRIALPGEHTTATLLFKMRFPEAQNLSYMVFSDIEKAVLHNKADVGVLIHEVRFTYQNNGLVQLLDFGQWWEQETGYALPLGFIVVKRSLPGTVRLKLNILLRESIEKAFSNPAEAMEFVKKHAQKTDDSVIRQHILTYVNNYTLTLKHEGRDAIRKFYEKAIEKQLIPIQPEDIIIEK